MKLTAYSVKLRKQVEIANPKIVTLKNGRKAVQGVAAEANRWLNCLDSRDNLNCYKYVFVGHLI